MQISFLAKRKRQCPETKNSNNTIWRTRKQLRSGMICKSSQKIQEQFHRWEGRSGHLLLGKARSLRWSPVLVRLDVMREAPIVAGEASGQDSSLSSFAGACLSCCCSESTASPAPDSSVLGGSAMTEGRWNEVRSRESFSRASGLHLRWGGRSLFHSLLLHCPN